jgi:hypothetical protein
VKGNKRYRDGAWRLAIGSGDRTPPDRIQDGPRTGQPSRGEAGGRRARRVDRGRRSRAPSRGRCAERARADGRRVGRGMAGGEPVASRPPQRGLDRLVAQDGDDGGRQLPIPHRADHRNVACGPGDWRPPRPALPEVGGRDRAFPKCHRPVSWADPGHVQLGHPQADGDSEPRVSPPIRPR